MVDFPIIPPPSPCLTAKGHGVYSLVPPPPSALASEAKGPRDGRDAARVAMAVPVENDGGSVRVFEALFRLKGIAQHIAVDHAVAEIADQVAHIGMHQEFAVLLGQFHHGLFIQGKTVGLVLPWFRPAAFSCR